jgi:hypothetical protein
MGRNHLSAPWCHHHTELAISEAGDRARPQPAVRSFGHLVLEAPVSRPRKIACRTHAFDDNLMVRPYASEVPAPRSEQADRGRMGRELPRNKVGLPVPRGDSELSAPGLECARGPEPAFWTLVNLGPEPFLGGAQGHRRPPSALRVSGLLGESQGWAVTVHRKSYAARVLPAAGQVRWQC